MQQNNNNRSNKKSWILFTMSLGLIFVAMSPQLDNPMIGVVGGLAIVLMAVILLRKEHKLEQEQKVWEERKKRKLQSTSK